MDTQNTNNEWLENEEMCEFPRELEETVLNQVEDDFDLQEEDILEASNPYKLAYEESTKRNSDLEDKVLALQNDIKRKNMKK
jgi:hypothetical protein